MTREGGKANFELNQWLGERLTRAGNRLNPHVAPSGTRRASTDTRPVLSPVPSLPEIPDDPDWEEVRNTRLEQYAATFALAEIAPVNGSLFVQHMGQKPYDLAALLAKRPADASVYGSSKRVKLVPVIGEIDARLIDTHGTQVAMDFWELALDPERGILDVLVGDNRTYGEIRLDLLRQTLAESAVRPDDRFQFGVDIVRNDPETHPAGRYRHVEPRAVLIRSPLYK